MSIRHLQAGLLLVAVLLAGFWIWLHQLETRAGETDFKARVETVPRVGLPPLPPENSKVAPPEPDPPGDEVPAEVIPDEFTVAFRDPDSLQAFLTSAGLHGITVLAVVEQLGMVRVRGPMSTLEELAGESAILEHNFVVEVPSPPDPDFWQSDSLRPFRADLLDFLGVSPGMELSGWGTGVTIAVLDSGWLGHEAVDAASIRVVDLVGSTMEGPFASHGTAVTGLVASRDPLTPGLAPGSEILSIRVLDAEGRGDVFTLAQGIVTAVDAGADVINMSLGGYGDSQVLRAAVDYATSRGVVLVASAGNDGFGRVSYPAAYESVIAVAAVDANGNHVPFSNFGEAVDLSAPGYQVGTIWGEGDYAYMDGTSASAPLVAAAAARILQSDPLLGAEAVMQILQQQANEKGLPGDDIQYGAGILNLERIENRENKGIYDIALADLYPAIEEGDSVSFPLYISLENRGTEYVSQAGVEVLVNGTPYYYRFSGFAPGSVQSVRLPVPHQQLAASKGLTVQATILSSGSYIDIRLQNNVAQITIRLSGTGGP